MPVPTKKQISVKHCRGLVENYLDISERYFDTVSQLPEMDNDDRVELLQLFAHHCFVAEKLQKLISHAAPSAESWLTEGKESLKQLSEAKLKQAEKQAAEFVKQYEIAKPQPTYAQFHREMIVGGFVNVTKADADAAELEASGFVDLSLDSAQASEDKPVVTAIESAAEAIDSAISASETTSLASTDADEKAQAERLAEEARDKAKQQAAKLLYAVEVFREEESGVEFESSVGLAFHAYNRLHPFLTSDDSDIKKLNEQSEALLKAFHQKIHFYIYHVERAESCMKREKTVYAAQWHVDRIDEHVGGLEETMTEFLDYCGHHKLQLTGKFYDKLHRWTRATLMLAELDKVFDPIKIANALTASMSVKADKNIKGFSYHELYKAQQQIAFVTSQAKNTFAIPDLKKQLNKINQGFQARYRQTSRWTRFCSWVASWFRPSPEKAFLTERFNMFSSVKLEEDQVNEKASRYYDRAKPGFSSSSAEVTQKLNAHTTASGAPACTRPSSPTPSSDTVESGVVLSPARQSGVNGRANDRVNGEVEYSDELAFEHVIFDRDDDEGIVARDSDDDCPDVVGRGIVAVR